MECQFTNLENTHEIWKMQFILSWVVTVHNCYYDKTSLNMHDEKLWIE